MIKFRIVYWFGSITTEFIVSAESEVEAIEKFKKTIGDRKIVRVIAIED